MNRSIPRASKELPQGGDEWLKENKRKARATSGRGQILGSFSETIRPDF